jgi:very-short-patch-repair endonuclease
MRISPGGKIIRGQNVRPDKLALAKRLRREMTPAERALWRALRRSALDGLHFRRQQVINGFIVDFYCDAAKVAVELDGSPHEEQWRYDESRDKAISRQGIRVLRISNEAMQDSEAVIAYIKEALRTSGKPNP